MRRSLAPSYDVEGILGGGGMATVFRAVDRRLGRHVAVKVLCTDVARVATVERFHREARILARLEHPNIVRVYDADEDASAGLSWYTMDVMSGGTLEQRLAQGALAAPDALTLAREVASALGAAHQAGVLHRDVKPANVFFSGGRALLGDFGIASSASDDVDTLTETGSSVGTPAYMAPELLYGGNPDERSDLWALGAVVYEAISGTRWSLADERDPWRAVPSRLRPALRRALANEPGRRWPTVAAFAGALPRSAGRRWPLIAGGTLLASVVILSGFRLYLDPPLPSARARAPVASQLAVVPFDGPADAGRRLSRYTVRSLEWYPLIRTAPFVQTAAVVSDARARGAEAGGGWLRSSYYVTGELLPTPASPGTLRLEVRDSADRLHRVVLVPPDNDEVTWGAAVADSIVSVIWPEHVSRFRELSRRGASNPAAVAAFVGCDDAFQLDDWSGADRHCREALRLDPTFPQALWTMALLHRWMRVPFDADLERLGHVLADLPDPFARLVRAQQVTGLRSRVDSFAAIERDFPANDAASFLRYNELFHRGPLLGIPLSSTLAAMEAKSEGNSGLWRALGDQLLWGYVRLGDVAHARLALHRRLLAAAAAGPESADRARLLRLAFWARFEPDHAGLAVRLLVARADSGALAEIASVFRFGGVPFDAPDVQRYIGSRLSRRAPTVAARGAGAIGEGVALIALGRTAEGIRRIDAGEMLRGSPDSAFSGCESRLALAAEGLYAAPASELTRCRRSFSTYLADARLRLQAAVVLARDAAVRRDSGALGAIGDALADAGGSGGPVAALVGAQLAAARGHFDEALALTSDLRSDDALRSSAGPWARAALFLSRGEWQAAGHHPADAAREWSWFENSDFESWPQGALQTAEVDAMLGGLARLRRAETADPAADDAACRDARRVLELWHHADAGLAPLRGRAQAVTRRCRP